MMKVVAILEPTRSPSAHFGFRLRFTDLKPSKNGLPLPLER